MTETIKEQEAANYGEEIAAREYEAQREEGRELPHVIYQKAQSGTPAEGGMSMKEVSDFLFNATKRNNVDVIEEEVVW